MATFKRFIEETEEKDDIRHTLSKLPSAHSKLIKDFEFNFQQGNTLSGDRKHVGYIDDGPKDITIAAPWNYGREFTFLHELAHKVWETLRPELKKEWQAIYNNTKLKDKDTSEECFAMAYANRHCNKPLVCFNIPAWKQFIDKISGITPERPASTSEQPPSPSH